MLNLRLIRTIMQELLDLFMFSMCFVTILRVCHYMFAPLIIKR